MAGEGAANREAGRGRAIASTYLKRSRKGPGPETREIVEGLRADFDEGGNVIGFDIDGASGKLDLSRVETIALPPAQTPE